LKQAIAEFNIGIVRIKVFIGSPSREIKESAVKADAVSNCFPEYFAAITNMANVAKDAKVLTAFASGFVSIIPKEWEVDSKSYLKIHDRKGAFETS